MRVATPAGVWATISSLPVAAGPACSDYNDTDTDDTVRATGHKRITLHSLMPKAHIHEPQLVHAWTALRQRPE